MTHMDSLTQIWVNREAVFTKQNVCRTLLALDTHLVTASLHKQYKIEQFHTLHSKRNIQVAIYLRILCHRLIIC